MPACPVVTQKEVTGGTRVSFTPWLFSYLSQISCLSFPLGADEKVELSLPWSELFNYLSVRTLGMGPRQCLYYDYAEKIQLVYPQAFWGGGARPAMGGGYDMNLGRCFDTIDRHTLFQLGCVPSLTESHFSLGYALSYYVPVHNIIHL